jgi:hypothetical protein
MPDDPPEMRVAGFVLTNPGIKSSRVSGPVLQVLR